MDKPVIDGFVFQSARDTELAKKEYSAIRKLKGKINIENMEETIELYKKLVAKKVFVTPVGLSFLRDMRDYLVENAPGADIPPVYVSEHKGQNNETYGINVEKLTGDVERLNLTKKKMSIAIVSLVVIIIGMFFIVATNENIGYFNAEEKVLNKYSAWQERLQNWEDELNEREDAIIERENALENQYPQ